ncbi:MAG: HEAT repeat domain-containing protein [Acidobacteriaceae bacterium]|nr:HEAT repeat domain-containing protein [Acidobacteriaceae bacterium]
MSVNSVPLTFIFMITNWFCTVVLGVGLFALIASGQNEGGYNLSQRINRIRDLGKRDSQAIPALTNYLGDPDRDIRVEAVKAIVKIDTASSLDPLIRATHDNDAEVQVRATDGIVNFYMPGYVSRGGLTGSFTRGVRQVKSYFSTRNNDAIDPDVTVRPEVSQALADEIRGGATMDSRANAARAAGILRASPAVASLVAALRSKDSEVIFESLVALQKIDDPSAGPAVSFLSRDLDDRVQATALETIGVLHSTSSASDVRSALGNARNAKIRRAALGCLAMLGIPDDRKTFQGYLSDKDADLRASALEGLGRIREPEDTPAIEEAYNEKNADTKIHLAAAFALVSEGKVDTSEFSPLRYLVENLDLRAQRNTAQAYLIELCRREDVRKALLPLVAEVTKDQKLALCPVLSASHNEDVVPVLNSLSKDIDPDVALAASKALRTVGKTTQ